jgi:geranylgeranyl reductase family protein
LRVERFDAIVVGAGPAGSTAAHRLAAAGARVLLVDKARFPRDKPCGGGLTLRAVRELPVPVDPVVEHVVDRMAFRLRYGRSFARGRGTPLILMTQRRRLDHYLAEQAAAAGADFRDGVKVSGVEADEGGVRALVDGSPVDAAVLIGADGANGVTARSLGLGGEPTLGVAFEGNVPYGAADRERYRGLALIELGTVPGGYGWVFPKGDHVNVGVGGWEHVGPTLRTRLRELCRRHAIDPDAVESLRGHRLPLRRPRAALARGRALLVGDAAGLVDPISGDGMYEAFVSSRLAAESTLDVLEGRAGTVAPYAQAISRRLGPMAAASWDAKIAFDRFPRLTFALAGAPLVWGVVERILTGELSHPGDARGPARAPLRAIEALARAVGAPGSGYRVEARAT